ncbi:MAG: hypothetical protein CSA68_07310 [Rhodobacterales bacterium]|nr:MAG: hypothetical protein CSA68_07310 [Rhodobacterales bacterium]
MTNLPHFARFWMVCRKPTGPRSKTEPRARYSSFEDAMTAAQKLSKENNAQFHVLETVATARPGDIEQETLL